MVITSQKVIYQKFSHFLLIFLTSPGARHCPALLRRDCNPAPCPLTTKYRHREAVCFHEKYQLVPMSKSQSEFPSLKKLCRALHSAFSWLKAPTRAFTFKTLLRHYAKHLTPLSLNV